MDSTSGAGDTGRIPNRRFVPDDTLSTGQASAKDTEMVPAAFTREYHVLAEVCASMSSGFMLLNQQRVLYTNSSALRLLRVNKSDLVAAQDFDVRKHLLSLAAEPQIARPELDHVWQHPDEDFSTDL